MTKVALFRDDVDASPMPYRAAAGRHQAAGRTAGEALDALASQLSGDEAATLVVARDLRAEQFFT